MKKEASSTVSVLLKRSLGIVRKISETKLLYLNDLKSDSFGRCRKFEFSKPLSYTYEDCLARNYISFRHPLYTQDYIAVDMTDINSGRYSDTVPSPVYPPSVGSPDNLKGPNWTIS